MQFIEKVCPRVCNWHEKSVEMSFAKFKMLHDFISQAYGSC